MEVLNEKKPDVGFDMDEKAIKDEAVDIQGMMEETVKKVRGQSDRSV